MRQAIAILLLFFVLSVSAQNVVLLKGPDYVVFRWGADTLDTALLPDFFVFVYGDSDTLNAQTSASQCVYFLNQNPAGVDALNDTLNKSLFVSLDDYACYCAIRQKRTRVVIHKN